MPEPCEAAATGSCLGVTGGDAHAGADRRHARADDDAVDDDAAFLADADPAVEPARRPAGAVAQLAPAGLRAARRRGSGPPALAAGAPSTVSSITRRRARPAAKRSGENQRDRDRARRAGVPGGDELAGGGREADAGALVAGRDAEVRRLGERADDRHVVRASAGAGRRRRAARGRRCRIGKKRAARRAIAPATSISTVAVEADVLAAGAEQRGAARRGLDDHRDLQRGVVVGLDGGDVARLAELAPEHDRRALEHDDLALARRDRDRQAGRWRAARASTRRRPRRPCPRRRGRRSSRRRWRARRRRARSARRRRRWTARRRGATAARTSAAVASRGSSCASPG